MRYLGIDFGTKKIGLAFSDELGTMGFPHAVIPNGPNLLTAVATLVKDEQIGAIVIGESRNFAGGLNPVAEETRAFAENLTRETGVPVYFEIETFTTKEAERLPTGEWAKPTRSVDASAAALILTSYLSRKP